MIELNQTSKIICPSCRHEFSVEAEIARQLEKEFKEEFENKRNNLLADIKSQKDALRQQEDALKEQKIQQDEIIQKGIEEAKDSIRDELFKKMHADYEKKIESLTSEVQEGNKENQRLKSKEIEFEQLQRKYDNQGTEIQLQFEKEFNEKLKAEREAISKREQEKVQMIIAEKEKTIDDVKKQLKEMERKAEQGSMQLQGEVQEIAIENVLTEMFRFDEIIEVPKGKKGADVIQIVKNNSLETSGRIIYESKRTKAFSKSWIEKLKTDQLRENADIAVLISDVLPDEIDRVGIIDGVWICDFNGLQGVALILRESLLKINQAFASQINKGDKMNMLYNYLTSNEFRLQIESIVEGFIHLKDSISKERIAMESLWKERGKQIEKVLLNMANFYGAIKGIAGKAIPSVPLLELPSGEV